MYENSAQIPAFLRQMSIIHISVGLKKMYRLMSEAEYIDSLIGVPLGKYRVDKLLGKGGMARVYRGIDLDQRIHVAIKVIDTPHIDDEQFQRRFKLEWQAIRKLNHPNIVGSHEFGRYENSEFIVMQYIEGVDLDKILAGYARDKKYMSVSDIKRLTSEIASGLDHMHHQGIIHRDLKPANIMLDTSGTAIISDFGLALHVDIGTKGSSLGSPNYIAPEQVISSAKAVPQSDIYALGIMLYEMFTNRVPFNKGKSYWDLALKHVEEEAPQPSTFRENLNPEYEAIIMKAIEKKPYDRYQSGRELVDELMAVSD